MDEYDIVGYYPDFRLPSWFDGPDGLRHLLKALWDRRYRGVDEEEDGPAPWSVREAYATLVDVLWGQGGEIGYQRCVYLGWSLALACLPTFDRLAPDNPMPKLVLGTVPSRLDKATGVVRRDWRPLFPQLSTGTPCQEFDEALLVFWAFTRLLEDPQDVRPTLLEMLRLCLLGVAINEGGDGRRDMWNWVLVEVVPAAWTLRLPDFIWTWPMPPHPAAERRPKALS